MILWCGQLVSDLGSGISGFAAPLLILALTNSPALAGVAGTIGAIAYLIFALPAGALVDRWDRKRVMMVCDTGRALSLVSIPIAAVIGHLTVWQLYATSAIESSLYVFFSIAQVAALPRVVPREQLAAASVQNTGGNIATTILAPSVGGFLYQAVGRTVPFLADALSYAASALSLALIRVPFQEQRVARPRHLRAEIVEGVTWLWGQPLIRYMAFITSGLRGVGVGQALIIIVLARHQHASPAVIGLIFSIGSVGGVAGAFLAPSIQRRFTFGQVTIASLWVEALLWPCLALAPNPLLLGLVVAGMSIMGPSSLSERSGLSVSLMLIDL
ncbi:MAG: MFS transporter [Chloroflexota bacterium]|nr:MFS transporter [Chloroflexota bacterium]